MDYIINPIWFYLIDICDTLKIICIIITIFLSLGISLYVGLKNAEEGTTLYYAPNNWKTEKGALRWAIKHGYSI